MRKFLLVFLVLGGLLLSGLFFSKQTFAVDPDALEAYQKCIKEKGSAEACKDLNPYTYFRQGDSAPFTETPQDLGRKIGQAAGQAGTGTGWNAELFGHFLNTVNVSSLGIQILPPKFDSNGKPTGATGAVDTFASGIDYMIRTRPASSIDYIAYMGNRLRVPGSPEPAYAATGGVGFNSLAPVLTIWTTMRNVAYFGFAVIFIVVGLMIMFRVKIDPKTAANIQSALPKIILALVLVTFSYAIAGFLIDLMYVVINLILALFSGMGLSGPVNGIKANLDHSVISLIIANPWDTGSLWSVVGGAAGAVGNITQELVGGRGMVQGPLIGLVTNGLAYLIIAIAVLWALFKTWLMLLGAYANIILNIIFAPLYLMIDAIPGQNQFGNWMRNMLSYLLAFPAVVVIILIATALAGTEAYGKASATNGFVPPLIGGNNQSAIQALVGLAILLTMPKIVEMIQAAIKTPENKYGSAWGEALGKGGQAAQAGFSNIPQVRQYEMAKAGYEKERGQQLAGESGFISKLARRGAPAIP